jgi:hypothetical protein
MFDDEIKAEVQRAFQNHALINSSESEWCIARRKDDGRVDWCMQARIWAPKQCGHVAVLGDIAPMVFAHGPAEPRDRIRWLSTEDVSYYVHQKAQIGLSDNNALVNEYDESLARKALQEFLDEEDISPRRREALREAMHLVYDREALVRHIVHRLPEGIDLVGIGQRCAHRIYCAWAAIRRLNELLTEQESA